MGRKNGENNFFILWLKEKISIQFQIFCDFLFFLLRLHFIVRSTLKNQICSILSRI